jgi:hypothetical protein
MPGIYRLTIAISVAIAFADPGTTRAFAQPSPREIQQHQMAAERALRESAEREQQQHQAQIEQMRQIDRQQAGDAREQAERQARAAAITAQQQQYLLQQQAAARQAQDKGGEQDRAQSSAGTQQQPSLPVPRQVQPVQAQQQSSPSPHWSFSNMSGFDKAGLAALGVVLVALAFAAGIIPSARRPG